MIFKFSSNLWEGKNVFKKLILIFGWLTVSLRHFQTYNDRKDQPTPLKHFHDFTDHRSLKEVVENLSSEVS